MKIYSILYKSIAVVLTLPLLWFFFIGVVGANFAQIMIVALLFVIIWSGAVLAGKKSRKCHLLSVFIGAVISLPLLYRLGGRLLFVLEHGSMEGPNGYGSPMAFVLNALIEMLFFVPFFIILIFGIVLSAKGKKEKA